MNEYLYRLLPLIYRELDFKQPQPLRAVMAVLENAHDKVDESILRLYQDWFIETCHEERIPLIADLVNLGELNEETVMESDRRYVANYIAYNRRSGTEQVLNNALQDVSDMACYALNSADKTMGTWTDKDPLQQPRTWSGSGLAGATSDTPFSPASRFASFTSNETQMVWSPRGSLHPNQVSLYLWQLQPVRFDLAQLTPSAQHENGFYLSPFAQPLSLCHLPQSRASLDEAAKESDYPYQVNRNNLTWEQQHIDPKDKQILSFFRFDPQNGQISAIPDRKVKVVDLGKWETKSQKHAGILIDPKLARVLVTEEKLKDHLLVSYNYPYNGCFGAAPIWRNANQQMSPDHRINSIHTAHLELDKWLSEIGQNAKELALGVNLHFKSNKTITIDLKGEDVTLWAEDYCMPVIAAHLKVINSGKQTARLTFHGLFFKGKISLGDNVDLSFEHCTLENPIEPVLEVITEQASIQKHAKVTLGNSLLVSKRMPEGTDLYIADTAISVSQASHVRTFKLMRSTLIGTVTTMGDTLVEDSLIKGQLFIQNPKNCEVLFSWISRFEPQPGITVDQVITDKDVNRDAVQFKSERYFDQDFARLTWGTIQQILNGASNGEEMGVMNSQRLRLKEKKLKNQLTKFLPMGLEVQTYFIE